MPYAANKRGRLQEGAATEIVVCNPNLVQLLCDFSGLVSLAREGSRRQITECRVRPSGVVVLSPIFDSVSGVVHR